MIEWALVRLKCFDGLHHKAGPAEKGAGAGVWTLSRRNGSADVLHEAEADGKDAGIGVDGAWNLELMQQACPRGRGGQARCCMRSLDARYTQGPMDPRMTTCYFQRGRDRQIDCVPVVAPADLSTRQKIPAKSCHPQVHRTGIPEPMKMHKNPSRDFDPELGFQAMVKPRYLPLPSIV